MNGRRRLILMSLWSCTFVSAAEFDGMRYVMGTLLKVEVQSESEEISQAAVQTTMDEIERWDHLLSTYKPDSEISQLNQKAGSWVALSTGTLEILKLSLHYAKISGGAFEPTIGAFIQLWGFQNDSPRVPSSSELRRTLHKVNYKNLELDEEKSRARLLKKGMAVDLGAIGKGFAMDKALTRTQKTHDIGALFMDFGGQLLYWDRDEDQNVHQVTPRHDRTKVFPFRSSGSVAASSQSERFINATDFTTTSKTAVPIKRTFGHILNPKTGNPVSYTDMVIVFAKSATEADVFSTILFVLGPDSGTQWIETQPDADAWIQWRDQNGVRQERASTGWDERTDTNRPQGKK